MKDKAQQAYGRRITAGFIDLAIWLAIFIVASIFFGTVVTSGPEPGVTAYSELSGWPLVFYLLAGLVYFILMEWRFGATVGKLLTGVRVVSEDGKQATLEQITIRNLVRIVDAFPYFIPYVVGIIIVAGDGCKRRLGDKEARTCIVLR